MKEGSQVLKKKIVFFGRTRRVRELGTALDKVDHDVTDEVGAVRSVLSFNGGTWGDRMREARASEPVGCTVVVQWHSGGWWWVVVNKKKRGGRGLEEARRVSPRDSRGGWWRCSGGTAAPLAQARRVSRVYFGFGDGSAGGFQSPPPSPLQLRLLQ